MMAVVNKHADMEDTERAHRRHKTKNDSSERPSQWDNHPKHRRDDRHLSMGRSMTALSRRRTGTASMASRTPSLSPRGPSSAPPSTKRTWIDS